MKMRHVRTGKDLRIGDALTFFSSEREQLEEAFAGDIIGLHNHGTIQIGDTFTEGEALGLPVSRTSPRNCSAAYACVTRSSPTSCARLAAVWAEGARPGVLPRAQQRHHPRCRRCAAVRCGRQPPEGRGIQGRVLLRADHRVLPARWIECSDKKKLEEFSNKAVENLAIDGGGHLTYLAPTRVNLALMEERWPDVKFRATREHH